MKEFDKQVEELTDLIERLVSLMKMMEHNNLETLANDINFQELQVIVFLGKFGAHKMNNIAQKVNISVSNLTFIIDKLFEKGFVIRNRSLKDRRIVLVELTEMGTEAFEKHRHQKIDLSKRILQNFNDKERSQFIALLKKSFLKF